MTQLALIAHTTSDHVVGARPLPLPPGVFTSAVFGGLDDIYRYRLRWVWESTRGETRTMLFIGMNPSVADRTCADRTLLKLYRLANNLNCNALIVCNSMAYRATNQRHLLAITDPVGPDNDRHVQEASVEADMILLGYGTPHARLRDHGTRLARMLHAYHCELHVLRLSKNERPEHPLYIPAAQRPVTWVPSAAIARCTA